jgi:Fe2+ or Zn2+ uptake regulation protein
MSEQTLGKPTVAQREVAIIDYLRIRREPALVSEIFEGVTQAIGDTISRPYYYKLLDRLVAAGKVEQIEDESGRKYIIAPHLHASNRLTLDDVYEMLPFFENTESMARAIEAQEYFISHKNTVLHQAAEALSTESAVDLFFLWINDLYQMLEKDLESYHMIESEGPLTGVRVLADAGLEQRLQTQCDLLRNILYRQLSIPHEAIDIPEWNSPGGLKSSGKMHFAADLFREALKTRVFGVGEKSTVIGLVTIDQPTLVDAMQEMIISASDGSFHAGTLGLRTARGYIEDESFIVTFNNSVAYVRSSERIQQQRQGLKKFFHTAPLTRQTLDDPAYKGMVLAPFMFPTLTESEYEHMTRTATDVVQMRVDDAVFSGKARDVFTGEMILPPRVHFRDGTITPQERGFNHYYQMNPYGEIAREGIIINQSILQRIMGSRGTPQIFAGAVKTTQIKLFSLLINWFISKGSKITKGKAIEPGWNIGTSNYISDIDVMTMLLSSLEPLADRNGFWMSCVVLRQFASLTEFYDTVLGKDQTWFDILKSKRRQALDDHLKFRGEMPYHALISEQDLANDPYLYLLENADYASFYIGHTSGNPAPKIPRYEFLCSFRNKKAEDAKSYVSEAIREIGTALLTCKFSEDRDHNFLSNLSIVKIIPSVIAIAHEFAKQMGKKLEGDFKSAVVARLAAKRKQPITVNDAEIRPTPMRQYLQRFSAVRKLLPPAELHDDER